MKKVILPSGSKTNFPTLISDLQNYIQDNLYQILHNVFNSYGVFIEGVSDTSLQLYTTGATVGNVNIHGGRALTESGEYIYLPSDVTNAFTVPYLQTTVPLYLVYSGYQNTPVDIVNGFVYGQGISTANSRVTPSYYLSFTNPGISGLLLGNVSRPNVTVPGDSPAVIDSDRRGENILRLDSRIQMFHDVTISGSEINNLFRQGIINYQDGGGDRWVVTQIISYQPNTVITINTPTLIWNNTRYDNNHAVLDALVRIYKTTQMLLGTETSALNAFSSLGQYLLNWYNSHSPWAYVPSGQQIWGDTTALIGIGNMTISGFAQSMVTNNYATTTQVGLIPTSGHQWTYNDIQATIIQTEYALYDTVIPNLRASLEAQVPRITSLADTLTKVYYVSPQMNLTWTAPAEVDNEAIKYYNLRLYQVNTSTWTTVPTELEIRTNTAVVRVLDFKTREASLVMTVIGNPYYQMNGAQVQYTPYTITFTDSIASAGITRDCFAVISGVQSNKNIVRNVNTALNSVDFQALFSNNPTNEYIKFYKIDRDNSSVTTQYNVTINDLEDYILYVQSVSESNVVSDWSAGLYISTTTLQNSDGKTLADLTAEMPDLNGDIQNIKITNATSAFADSITELRLQVAAVPNYTAISSLWTAVNNLTPS